MFRCDVTEVIDLVQVKLLLLVHIFNPMNVNMDATFSAKRRYLYT